MSLLDTYCHNCFKPDHTSRNCWEKITKTLEPEEKPTLPCGCGYPYAGDGKRPHIDRRVKIGEFYRRVIMCRNHNRNFYIYNTIKFSEITLRR